ncbi:MAG: histidinol-phosphatase HisJ family protein [Chloroflexota bacterium]|nr:histidinol-phosphatase HisJ family protein [Chloroflexota bacterium]
MGLRCDYHLHSQHSSDADTPMVEMAEAAWRAGLQELAFTDHLEWYGEDDATGYLMPERYFAELRKVRAKYGQQLQLLAGLELGSSHRFLPQARALLAAWPWDYILGAIHWAAGLPGWQPVAFAEGMERAYQRYFEELVLLAEEGEYDVLAHFDLVQRDAWTLCGRTLPITPYKSLIHRALKAVIARDKGLEINTSPWSMGLDDPAPGLTILRWYRELGGEILVLGSDAHRPGQVGQHFARARALAQAAGFTRFARFKKRNVVDWVQIGSGGRSEREVWKREKREGKKEKGEKRREKLDSFLTI